MNQELYIQELLEQYDLQKYRPAYIPLKPGNSISSEDSPKTDGERRDMKNVSYRELIRLLGYISQCIRPDIAFAISKLAQFLSNPGRKHWIEANQTLRYLINIPYKLFCNNRAAIDFAKNRIERNKTKHIDIAFHNVREKIDNGTIMLSYVPSTLNIGDILTKAISRKTYEEQVKK
ncbi:hypothetical protein ACFW04_014619 [Cataglyphis niger]